jgi:L-proline---[L-prolyl-carrier protein] ligase
MLIHERFLACAAAHPDAEAIAYGGTTLSYRQCAARVERLARVLASHMPAGSRLAINTLKSADAILLMLACLRAGLTYVPLDPGAPVQRRRGIVRSCEASALVVDAFTAKDWLTEAADSPPLLWLGDAAPREAGPALVLAELERSAVAPTLGGGPQPEDLAYILYTSGSTGDPKGAMITHENAAAFVQWGCEYFDLTVGDRVAVHAPLHFDLPIFDVYVSLARGATVVPVDERTVLFPEALSSFLRSERISVLYAVPSALNRMVVRAERGGSPLSSIRLLLYAGEAFPVPALRKLLQFVPNARVFNLYGPIETNVITVFEVQRSEPLGDHVPLGRAIGNAQVELLDSESRRISAPDVEGEIVAFGPSVFAGYLGIAASSAPIPEDVFPAGFARGYRTGDYARYDDRGLLHFMGRRDALIKTRGFRVELGDVEANLLRHPSVQEAAVIALPHHEYTNLLHAFVVLTTGASATEAELGGWCRKNLSSHMVPHRIMIRTALPQTSTGKTSRRALLDEQQAFDEARR